MKLSAVTPVTERRFIRGVNIGGWLVLERFITPYFFAVTDCHINGDFRFYPGQINAPPTSSPLYKPMDSSCTPVTPYPIDEWTLTSAFNDKDLARQYLEIHYDNFVTREDIRSLRAAKVTHIRVPLGHWIMGDIAEGEPYIVGGWSFFKRLVGWCREEGLEVWPDIHTAPGSQNGFDNSGHALKTGPSCHGWDQNTAYVERSLKAVQDITEAIAQGGMLDVVTGFGVLNEPFANCDINVVRDFDQQAYDIVRQNMPGAHVYIGDIFNATKWNDGFWVSPEYEKTYLDSHYYHVFDERPRHLSPRQHIALVCQRQHQQTVACCYEDEPEMTIPSKGISRIIGEWSASFDTLVCDKLDDVMNGIATTGIATEFDRIIPRDRMNFLERFVQAQMVTYEAAKEGVSSGWFFWTLKMEGGAFAEWDFLRGLREGWIHTLPAPEKASEDIYGACYDIIFETNDSMSIVHEFPDPKSLDPTNWQGFDIDDDIVVSHGESLIVKQKHRSIASFFHHESLVLVMLLCIAILLRFCKQSHRGYRKLNDDNAVEMHV